MDNKSEQLNTELEGLILKMGDNLKNVLHSMPDHLMIIDYHLDSVYGYYYDYYELIERNVRAIRLVESEGKERIEVLLDDDELYDRTNIEEAKERKWYSLFGGFLLSWFTLININEVLHEHINSEYNIVEQ